MIIKKDRFIFVHIPKNMGTFVELLSLNNYFNINLQTDDKIFQDYYYSLFTYTNNETYSINGFKSLHHLPLSYYLSHIPSSEIQQYKILFISRNPYTRIISLYKFTNEHLKKKITFNQFMKSGYFKNNILLPHFSKRQIDFIDTNITNLNVKIIKFENKELLKEYFINNLNYKYYDIEINKANDESKIELTKEQIEQINEYYKDDFSYFGYEMIV